MSTLNNSSDSHKFDLLISELGLEMKYSLRVFEFFVKFSKFEYSLLLKRFNKKNKEPEAEVDWDKFANHCIRNHESEVIELLKKHTDFLLRQPPKKLFFSPSGNLAWERSTSEQAVIDDSINQTERLAREFRDLKKYLTRVRNNLFHGGKSMDTQAQTTDRMSETIALLDDLKILLDQIN